MKIWALIVGVLALALAGVAHAETIEQAKLSDLKFLGMDVKNDYQCKSFVIEFNDIYAEPEFYPMMLLKSDFTREKANSYVSVRLNGNDNEHEVGRMDKLNGTPDFVVYFPKNNWLKRNEVFICIYAWGGEKVKVSGDSLIGIYKAPRILLTRSLSKALAREGEKIRVLVDVKNYGSEATVLQLKNENDLYDRDLFTVVSGDTEITDARLEPGQRLEMEYFIRAKKSGSYGLLPAVVIFKNAFNLPEEIESKVNTLTVTSAEAELRAKIVPEKNTYAVGDRGRFEIILENIGTKEATDVVVKTDFGTDSISSIPAESLKKEEFILSSKQKKTFKIGCEVSYNSGAETKQLRCEEVTIKFENKVNPNMVFGAIGGAIALIAIVLLFRHLFPAVKTKES